MEMASSSMGLEEEYCCKDVDGQVGQEGYFEVVGYDGNKIGGEVESNVDLCILQALPYLY